MTVTALFSPVRVGALTLPNRFMMSALTRNRSKPTNIPNSINKEYYLQRAKGGAGLIVTEGTLVSQQGTEWEHAPGIWNKEQVDGWKTITEGVHDVGGKIFLQLWHVGRVAHPDAPEQKRANTPVYAPSAISARGGKFRFIEGQPGYATPTAVEDPRTLVELYRKGAINAKEAGFDGVELHSANGYLISQFLDSNSNQRTDEWGGSVENRSRFALEVVKALVDVWGPDRVGIKLSPAGGYNDVGMPLDETKATFGHLIAEVEKLKIAYITFVRYTSPFEIDGQNRATPHDVIEHYRPLVKHAKFIVNAGLTPEEAEKLIESGTVDVVSFGSKFIGNPDLPKRVQQGVELNTKLDYYGFYNTDGGMENLGKGYTDYPAAT